MDLRGRHHHVARPCAVRVQRHEFDEAHHDVFFAREFREGFHFVVVQPAHQHRIHFHRTQRRSLRRLDSRDHIVESLGARHLLEFFAVQRIEADVDAIQARGHQLVAALGEQEAVGGHRKILHADGFQARDELFHAGTHQRLAARHAHFADAHAHQDAHQPLVFVPFEQRVLRHVIFGVRGAAIHAAEIAAVRYRDAQVRDWPSEFVYECHRRLDAAKNKNAHLRVRKRAKIPAG